VLLELVLLEGWTAEYIFAFRIVLRQFFILVIKEATTKRVSPFQSLITISNLRSKEFLNTRG